MPVYMSLLFYGFAIRNDYLEGCMHFIPGYYLFHPTAFLFFMLYLVSRQVIVNWMTIQKMMIEVISSSHGLGGMCKNLGIIFPLNGWILGFESSQAFSFSMIKKGFIINFIMQFMHHLLLDADKSIKICVFTKACLPP